jgi:hypothetical protein
MNYQELYIGLITAVMKADNHVDPSERDVLLDAMKRFGVGKVLRDKFTRIMNDPATSYGLDEVPLPATLEASALLWLLRDAYFVAGSDGNVSKVEEQILHEFLSRLGIEARQRNRLLRWAAKEREHHIRGLELIG